MAYTQIQKIENPTALADEKFGIKSIVDGYHMVVISLSNPAEVFKRNINGVWELTGTINGLSAGAMYNNYIATTAIGPRSIWIYNKDSLALLQQNTESALTSFGNSVAISENYIVVGQQSYNSNTGQVIVYKKNGTDSWETAGNGTTLTANGGSAQDFFGSAVATNDESIIVGAYGDNQGKGAVYIFQKNEDTGVWEQTQKVFASDGESNDRFGASVSVSGDFFVAGARFKDNSTTEINAGAAYVFKYSTSWYEIDKLSSVDEISPEGDHFGESVYINGDHIIVGSPAARLNKGVADVFYKKRSWGHLKKILGSDTLADDDFGTSVSISGRFTVVGSPDNESGTTGGSVYVYEDPIVNLRLAQEFNVDGQYLPTKASIYLKRVGENTSNFWPLYNTIKTVIDATNFSTISDPDEPNPSVDEEQYNSIIFEDTIGGFTGNGYMISKEFLSTDNYKTLNYPIRAINSDTYDLWIRVINTDNDSLEIEVLIDGVVFDTISTLIDNPSDGLEWSWVSTTLVVPDNRDHILGIRIKENNTAIDKIYIEKNSDTPYTEGPDLTIAPYFTTHLRVYDTVYDDPSALTGAQPNSSLLIYDYKNSITEIIQDDWYNFNIRILDSSGGYQSILDFAGSFFLVLAVTGSNTSNFATWELIDNDQQINPSADSINPVSAVKF